MQYEIVRVEDGLLFTTSRQYGQQMWSLATLRARHQRDACAICGETVGRRAYRPITNRGNRMRRICTKHAGQ